jgi:Fic/DOC family
VPLLLAGENRANARQLQRLAEQGKLRRIHPGIYTDDLAQPIDAIVRRELYALCAAIVPGAIISHRSAFENKPTPGGSLFLTGGYRREISLPGTTLRVTDGSAPLDSDIKIPTFAGDAFVSSQARAVLENLQPSRGDAAERRTLGAARVEQWLDRFAARHAASAMNQLRDTARRIAGPLGLPAEFERLDSTIGAMLGTRTARLTNPAARARAAQRPYDGSRMDPFGTLAEALAREPLQVAPVAGDADPELQAFVETYFSNYIEGTEFEIEEAHEIVVKGRPVKYREDDSHDILGTYKAILRSKQSPVIPDSADTFVGRLKEWNSQVIESRQDKNPGEFKTERNRFGSTWFVDPDLVLGTLHKGYELIMRADTPANRALLAMFIVAEVHPFTDGNGRTARMAMNQFLTHAGLTRVIIPTVFRDDYLGALKALSSDAYPVPLIRMFTRAARFSRWLDMSSTAACFAALMRAHAMAKSNEARLTFDDLEPTQENESRTPVS